MTQQWNRIDGMMIAQTLNPEEVAEDLSKRGIVARLEWFDRSTRLLGFVMASNDDGKLATIGPRSEILKPGPTEQELADELATTYKAEVRLGAGQSDHLDEVVDGPHDDARADEAGDDDSGKDAPDTADETASLSQDELRAQFNGDMNEPLDAVKSRIIEIGRTPTRRCRYCRSRAARRCTRTLCRTAPGTFGLELRRFAAGHAVHGR